MVIRCMVGGFLVIGCVYCFNVLSKFVVCCLNAARYRAASMILSYDFALVC